MRSTAAVVTALAVPVLVVALLAAPASVPSVQAAAPDGKALFLAQKCNLCHSIEAAGIERTSKSDKTKGPDLGKVAERRDAAWMKRFLKKEEEVNGKKHMKAFTGTPEELDALVEWLRKQ